MRDTLYPLGDSLTFEERAKFGIGVSQEALQAMRENKIEMRAVLVAPREFRRVRKGEWYLSGAIPSAYRAANDLECKYYICRLVKTQTVVTTVVNVIQS